ncbi:MAG: DGQHR domain-containing protein [Byssovorax sp.]
MAQTATKAPKYNYPAIRFSQRGKSSPPLVIFTAPVGDILKWAQARELGPKSKGPQRPQRDARVDAIKRFLSADQHNTIPTAIILAFGKKGAKFTADASGGSCGLLKVKQNVVAEIVDGQHRLHGVNNFDPSIMIAVVGLLDVDEVEKAFQFLIINNKSYRVPATHVKALIASMADTKLPARLRGARLAFDAAGIRDVDLVNSEPDSPFFQTIAWAITDDDKHMVQATAVQMSLSYLGSLGISEYDDRDTCRTVFLSIWKIIKESWGDLWHSGSRLVSKVGILCLTRFVADLFTSWADNEQLEIDVSNLQDIEDQTRKIVKYMDKRFWSTPWAEKAQGGFDTTQGRERVVDALVQLYRNGRKGVEWYTDIDILDRSAATSD